jgi:hypothetical protein
MVATPSAALAIPAPAMSRAHDATLALTDSLAEALHSESQLLSDLATIMRRQREAVAQDDLDGVDDSVFATHRVLVTLGEARRRRRSIYRLLGVEDAMAIAGLYQAFPVGTADAVRAAADLVANAARALQQEVEINRRVLRHVIDAGDRFVRALCGAATPGPVGYAPESRPPERKSGGALVDRRV